MALYALWPLLANAEPRVNFFAMEVCTVNKAPFKSPAQPVELPAHKNPVSHCAFCASGGCAAALTATPLVPFTLAAATVTAITSDSSTDPVREPFTLAASRAPPVFLQ